MLIMFSLGSSGCENSQPLSSIPKVITYYANNQSNVFVTGDDYMFDQIRITLDNETIEDEFTYGLKASTNNTTFSIRVMVLDNRSTENRIDIVTYTYDSNVTVDVRDIEEVLFTIIDNNHEREVERESPYEALMEKE